MVSGGIYGERSNEHTVHSDTTTSVGIMPLRAEKKIARETHRIVLDILRKKCFNETYNIWVHHSSLSGLICEIGVKTSDVGGPDG